MTNDEYHADTTAISASGLKLFMRSPRHYSAAYLYTNQRERVETPAMRIGTAVHCATLEPEEFRNRYDYLPEGTDLRTKAGKELRDALTASGKIILSPDDMRQVIDMASAFTADPRYAPTFAIPHGVERSIYATINGVLCKARPDFITNDCTLVVDVKTCRDASPEEFGRQAWNLGYHIQAAFYRRVIQAATGTTPKFCFACVESEYPHLTAWYTAPDYLLEYADGVIDLALDRFAECMCTNTWPGYPGTGDDELQIPGWAQRIIENDGIDDWEISNV